MKDKQLYQIASICFFIAGLIFLIFGQSQHTIFLLGILFIILFISFMVISRNTPKL